MNTKKQQTKLIGEQRKHIQSWTCLTFITNGSLWKESERYPLFHQILSYAYFLLKLETFEEFKKKTSANESASI